MRILGIITEYNPYHLGHRLHLQEAKKLIQPDLTICVMSSSFVQRGEPAMISYQKRAAIAISEGIDIVIELPLVYACQSADYFAKGAVTLLGSLTVVSIFSLTKSLKTLIISMLLSFFVVKFVKFKVGICRNVWYNSCRR